MKKLLFLLVVMAPQVVFAHPGHSSVNVVGGFLHPLTGIDHIVAMVAVGLLAAYVGGNARWMFPVSFLGGMMIGGGTAMLGLSVLFVETMIIVSLLCIGTMLIARFHVPRVVTVVSLGVFGFFHGFAHMAEVGEYHVLLYGAGFLSATALLHLVGLFGGFGIRQMHPKLFRTLGMATALCGVYLLFGVV
jgi:urease accessory protein